MVEELLDNTKLIKVPKALAAQLKLVSGRLGISLPDFTADALSQALRVDDMGSNIEEAVDTYHLVNIHRGAGLINLSRNTLSRILGSLPDGSVDMIKEDSMEAGRWYGAYISSKLPSDRILWFLESDLRISWNLDEVDIVEEDVLVNFRASSFNMTRVVTDLFVLYTRGIFDELGYEVSEEDVLPGLVSFRLLKTLN